MTLAKLGRMITRHFWWKFASLVLGVLLWVALLGEPDLVTIQTVPVLYRNLPPSLLLLSDTVASVQLELRGPPRKLTRDNLAEVAVMLDLSGVSTPGEQTFTLSRAELAVPEGITFLRAVPSQLQIRFDRSMTKDVPVEVRVKGSVPHGFRISGRSVTPERLRVSGPESRVQPIEKAETDPVDVSGVTTSKTARVNSFVADPRVQFDSPSVVMVKIDVERSTAQ